MINWYFIDPPSGKFFKLEVRGQAQLRTGAPGAGRDSMTFSRTLQQAGCLPTLEVWTPIYEWKGFLQSLPPGCVKQMFDFIAQVFLEMLLSTLASRLYALYVHFKRCCDPVCLGFALTLKSNQVSFMTFTEIAFSQKCNRHTADWATTEGKVCCSCSDLLAAVVTEVAMIRRVWTQSF